VDWIAVVVVVFFFSISGVAASFFTSASWNIKVVTVTDNKHMYTFYMKHFLCT